MVAQRRSPAQQLEGQREQDDPCAVVHETLHLDHRREPRRDRDVTERREDRRGIGEARWPVRIAAPPEIALLKLVRG